jgi:acyl-coenzyme A synthetase/AMP-(fatty) acid ligase
VAENAQAWWIDGATGARRPWSELEDLAGAPKAVRRPVCQPRDARDAVEEIVRGLVSSGPLTLVDPRMPRDEMVRLGLDPGVVNQESAYGVTGGAAKVEDWVRGRSGLRLRLFTSGSSGLPRSVEHALETLGRAIRIGAHHRNDVWALTYRPTHIAGVQVVLQALANGNPIVDCTGLTPAAALEAMRRHGVTHLSATPTFYRLLPDVAPLAGVRAVTLGGESVDDALLRRVATLFPTARLRNVYASTEGGTLLESDGTSFEIPARLRDRVEVRAGRLRVHRSLLGGLGGERPAAMDGDWYETGDRVDPVAGSTGRFTFAGRERRWVNVGGSKVDPDQAEALLRELPEVLAARVFGLANSVVGELLCAEVVRRPGSALDEAAVRTALNGRLPGTAIPRIIRFVDRLADTRSDKLSAR